MLEEWIEEKKRRERRRKNGYLQIIDYEMKMMKTKRNGKERNERETMMEMRKEKRNERKENERKEKK
jgi:hypothetical protein